MIPDPDILVIRGRLFLLVPVGPDDEASSPVRGDISFAEFLELPVQFDVAKCLADGLSERFIVRFGLN